MRTLVEYINEELNKRIVENLEVTYSANKTDIYVNCPETFQEDDIHQYIDDLLLEQMPSNQDIAEKYFRSNVKYINDAYFEYDSFSRLDYKKDIVDIDYDDSLGKDVAEDIKIVSFRLSGLRFKMLFTKFELMIEDDADVDETLETIFNAYESNTYNKSDVKFKYDSCEYDK